MFQKAVYFPEYLDEFLHIFQVLNVQKSLHRLLPYDPIIYDCKFIMSIYQYQLNNRKTVFAIEKLGTAILWELNIHVTVTNLEFDEKGETHEEELLQAE